jgi:hypothetical protein
MRRHPMKKAASSAPAAPRRMRGDATKRARDARGPSAASLREIPEIDFSRAIVRPNPFADRIAREGYFLPDGRHVMPLPGPGRPKKGEETGTVPRSVRFSPHVWKSLEKRAKEKGLTLHAALRVAIIEWAQR